MHYSLPVILFFFTLSSAFGQNSAPINLSLDSSIVHFNNRIRVIDHEQRYELRDSIYALFGSQKSIANEKNLGDLHAMIAGWYNYHDGGASDSIAFYQGQAHLYYKMAGETKSAIRALILQGQAYKMTGDYTLAEANFTEAMNYYKTIGDEKFIGFLKCDISHLYLIMEQYEKGLDYGKQSLDILLTFEDTFVSVPKQYGIMGRIFVELGRYEECLLSVENGLAYMKDRDMMGSVFHLTRLNTTKARALEKLGRYVEAEKIYREVHKTYEKYDNSDTWREGIGRTLHVQGKNKEAVPHALAAAKAYESSKSSDAWKSYETLKAIYEDLGEYKNAYTLAVKIQSHRDSLHVESIKAMENEALVKYEAGQKDEALKIKDKQINQQKQIQYLGIGLMVLLLSLLGLLFYNFRRNQKVSNQLQSLNTNLEKRNEEKEILLKEIHHRVKNNLQVISSLLNFQSRNIDDHTAKSAILDSQSRVSSMSLIHQKLYRGDNLAAVEMKSYLEVLAGNLIEAYSDENLINVKLDMPTIELDVDYAIPIGLIVNELITNSLKYAFPDGHEGAINIILKKEENDLVLKISDNGHGQSLDNKPEKQSGFGTELVEMLSIQLKAKMNQSVEKGFTSILRIPFLKAA